MTDALPPAVEAFKRLFQGEPIDIAPHLSDDIELRPPTYGKSWHGKPLIQRLLVFAAEELGGLRYDRCLRDGACHALRFEGNLDGKPTSGVDIVELGADGRIVLIEIFARPPGQMLRLRDKMGARVAQDPDVARSMGLA